MLPQKRAIDLLLVTTTLLAAFVAACAGGKPIDVGEPGGDDDDIDATFTTGAFEAIKSENCALSGCHIPSAPLGELPLPDAAGTLTVSAAYIAITSGGTTGPGVNTANPAQSLILTKGLNSVTHTGGQQWETDDATYETVLAWISSGAQMN